jgi:N-glycosylase/DNA lyase
VDLVKVAAMDDVEAMKELRRLPGVGEKVANCVLLFGFERLEAFPIDVWIERVLIEGYFSGESGVSRERLREFTREYFGRFGGYAQQYLFHHARTTRIRVGRKG